MRRKKIFQKNFNSRVTLYHMRVLTSKFTNNKKLTTMKKLFAILAIASVMTACGGAKTETPATDSASKMATDTTKKDTSKMAVDTTKKDTTKKM